MLWNHGGALGAGDSKAYWSVDILSPARTYFHGLIDWFLSENSGSKCSGKVAIVHSTAGAFPIEVASGAQEYCLARGLEHVEMICYGPEVTDFASVFDKIKELGPKLILEVGRIEDDLRFAEQLVASGVRTSAVGLIAAPLALFRERLGDKAEGFLGPSQWELRNIGKPEYGPTADEFLESMAYMRVGDVDYPMAQAYAGCLVAQRCIEAAGSLDNVALREAAGNLDFTTFYGRFKIDKNTGRQVGHTMPIVQWRCGSKVVVWPPAITHE